MLAAMNGGMGFQFHKGTIRTGLFAAISNHILLFQFHKGTIRTDSLLTSPVLCVSFQFHKGTIRTIEQCKKAMYDAIISIP